MTATTTTPTPDTETPAPDPVLQAKIERLREITGRITAADAEMNRMAVERAGLMLDLHDAGLNNVVIANIMGLTRQRVSTLMAPIIRERLLKKVTKK